MNRLLRLCFSDAWLKKLDDALAHALLETFLFLKIARQEKNIDQTKLTNRAGIFLTEARKRGIDIRAIKIFGSYTNSYRFFFHGNAYDYHEIPLVLLSPDISTYDAKQTMKLFLTQHHLPHAEGKCFDSQTEGNAYGKKLGFPLVVKPNDGTLSAHATYPIQDEHALKRAIHIAQRFQPEYIVERYVTGNLYRATVIGRTHVFVCQREAANVVGDGESTIEQLITQKNADPRRAPTDRKQTTLHTIAIDESLRKHLHHQHLTLKDVPLSGQKIFLSSKAILSAGCDVITRTQETHPDNKILFLRVAELLGTDLVGIDYIAPDISQPHTEQTTAILEINTLPYIDMHQNPSHGEPDPVAEMGWELVLEGLSKRKKSDIL